jgi:hypothetical protein
MKKLTLAILLMIIAALHAQNNTGSIHICWLPPSSNEPAPLGYHVHLGTVSHVYTILLDVGNVNTATINGLPFGTYYATISAYYPPPQLEGPLSNEFVYNVVKHKKL